jgi:hypothetical protein
MGLFLGIAQKAVEGHRTPKVPYSGVRQPSAAFSPAAHPAPTTGTSRDGLAGEIPQKAVEGHRAPKVPPRALDES